MYTAFAFLIGLITGAAVGFCAVGLLSHGHKDNTPI